MPMILNLATNLAITATGAQAGIRLNTSPFLGGQGHEAILNTTAIGGGGVVKIQGHAAANGSSSSVPAVGDAGWYDILTLNASSLPQTEVPDLPNWIRVNVSTVGTGTFSANLEGVQ